MIDGPYKKLIVWQKAKSLVKAVYALTKTFPADERYALTDQLRRAVVSIPSNIAEGYGRASNADYAHFLAIARGSLYEALTQLEVAEDLGYISAHPEELELLASEVGRMLGAMLKKYGSMHSSPSSKFSPNTSPSPSSLPLRLSPSPSPKPSPSPNPYA